VTKAVTHQTNDNVKNSMDDTTSKLQHEEEFELFHLKLNPEERIEDDCEDEAACNSIFNSEK
jgi:hypothetical protein